MDEVKRGPGRPKQDTLKKGKASWKPASLNVFSDLDPDFRYRMLRKDPENLAKKKQEGWIIASGVTDSAEHKEPGYIGDHNALTSVTEGKDWILGKLPNEIAEARDEYMNSETERRTMGLTAHIKKDLAKEGASSHGEITISTRKGTVTL